MTWQDIVLSVGQWIFAIALIPTIRGKDKPAFSSSIMTALVMTAFVAVYFSLKFWTAGISSTITTSIWYILAFQKWRINQQKNPN